MTASIHPTAVVDSRATIGAGVTIGPYCVVGPEVVIGDGTVLKSHVNVDGRTRIGKACTVWPFASIGTQTQDLKYQGGSPGVVIGDGTTLREYVTVNAATMDGVDTVVGSRCHIMAYSHVAHDCIVGDEVIMANAATLAGHVTVEPQAIIGGLVGVHQFVRIGRLSITGGCAKIVQDVPPFFTADGNPLAIRGINKIGLERRGIAPETIRSLKEAYRLLYRRKLGIQECLQEMSGWADSEELSHFRTFLQASERGITR